MALGRVYMGRPETQAHHGLLVGFLYCVTPDLCVAIILGWFPLQSHVETPRFHDPNVLGRAWLVCRRESSWKVPSAGGAPPTPEEGAQRHAPTICRTSVALSSMFSIRSVTW